ncbi:O-fucosyltransferase 23 [Rhodamnia argentea]|uniref:O-fucosyltransferase family protein n=1 Tax=Rhodamnia argentea TaxID=178133 RepID=A0ABM3GYP8_9MYRT|nr:O-fucosyltransferase 23 [Rhodamnia argentea]
MGLLSNCKSSKVLVPPLSSIACKCFALVIIVLVLRAAFISTVYGGFQPNQIAMSPNFSLSYTSEYGIRKDKFVEVPQIVWGLNNQKIAFARACLTARMLNRTLLMPRLSASLFYKEIDLLQPISFDKVFQFERFNSLCDGFVRLGYYSDVSNQTGAFEVQKGSGRRWTIQRDMDQLRQSSQDPIDRYEVIRITGKNPFLWHDHWPVKDYARIFECLVLVHEIARQADKVINKIREAGREVKGKAEASRHDLEGHQLQSVSYVAVHMRIEKDWMIHCKKLEQRLNVNQICSSKAEITERVGNILGLKTPTVVYLAVADVLLEDSSIVSGWKEGLLPFEKKKLGVDGIYKKYPYLIKSAIDYEVCLRADVFVGNSYSTFSSLIVLERTQKMLRMGVGNSCGSGTDVRWPSYAYNIPGESKGPQRWMTNMDDSSLQAISFGSNLISC